MKLEAVASSSAWQWRVATKYKRRCSVSSRPLWIHAMGANFEVHFSIGVRELRIRW